VPQKQHGVFAEDLHHENTMFGLGVRWGVCGQCRISSDLIHPTIQGPPKQETMRVPPQVSAPKPSRLSTTRERLYDFHQLIGHADLMLDDASRKLRDVDREDLVEKVETKLVGRNASSTND